MEFTSRILLAMFSSALLYMAGLLSIHDFSIIAACFAGVGTFGLGILAALK